MFRCVMAEVRGRRQPDLGTGERYWNSKRDGEGPEADKRALNQRSKQTERSTQINKSKQTNKQTVRCAKSGEREKSRGRPS